MVQQGRARNPGIFRKSKRTATPRLISGDFSSSCLPLSSLPMPARSRIVLWLPAVGWMLVIFLASTDALSASHTGQIVEPILLRLFPHITFAELELAHLAIRKTAHLIEYGTLGLLLWRAIPEHRTNPEIADWWRAGTALLVATFYAATDEYHQSFVPSRTASVRDVVIDCCGAAIALTFVLLANRPRHPRPPDGDPSPAA